MSRVWGFGVQSPNKSEQRRPSLNRTGLNRFCLPGLTRTGPTRRVEVDFGQIRFWTVFFEFGRLDFGHFAFSERKRRKKNKNGKKQKTQKEEQKCGRVGQSIWSVFVWRRRQPKAGDASTQTRLLPAFRVSTGLHMEHRWPSPKAGGAPHEGLRKVESGNLGVLGVRVLT